MIFINYFGISSIHNILFIRGLFYILQNNNNNLVSFYIKWFSYFFFDFGFVNFDSACLYEQKSSDVTISSEMDDSKRGFTAATVLPSNQGLLCVTADQQLLLYTTVEVPDKKKELILSKRLVGYNEEILDLKFLGEEEQYLAVATNIEQVMFLRLFPFSF